ncbi:S9 family peptidase [Sphingomonas naphthae]|uniref:S9 family peptidase n=1 Tax=Sphingomonas naphthae TaxID=1813468 RepID=A0ABY7TIK3_9SPHN|nr:S9 family peptidase [Sphingomonas naphthae]WCT72780.1 S9 family peptidase [Sphingomonas naphthae]
MKSITRIAALAATLLASTPLLARPITPTDLVSLSRVAAPAVSPDGRWLVWQQRETDLDANKGRFDLWRLDLKTRGATPQTFASTPDFNETDPVFAKDGTLWFVSNRKGDADVWHVDMAGGTPVQATSGFGGISGFKLSPQGDKLLVWADRKPGVPSLEQPQVKKDSLAGSARTYDQLFARHWDTWADGTRSQLFVLPLAGGKATGFGVPLAATLVGDAPSKPNGDGAEMSWSADGKTVYFALREAGRIEPLSTNLDIWSAPADGSAAPTNLTAANKATDNLPTVSPDGRFLAYAAMARATYEADRMVLHIRDLKTGAVRALAPGWDRSVETITWAANSASLYVTALDHFDHALFRVDLASGKVSRLSGDGSVAGVEPLGANNIVYAKDSLTAPADLYRMDEYGAESRLTSVNAAKLAGIDLPTATRFSFKGANGDDVWAYAVKPAGLAEGARAPIAFLVHGGPQGSFGNAWSYRWNPAVFAGAGFGAVLVDFHGSVGYGQAFTDAINKDWGGKPLVDLKAGLKAATDKFGWLDADHACAAGGSYGGYMMNWIAGNWPDRFQCLVVHAGVFDARAMAYETEELWFDEWEHGGHPYYEAAADYEKWNPVLKVRDWKTPMLVIHGEKDFRIPYTQGLAAFTAAQRRDIPSRLVIFPDENHWILKPKNSLQWHREVLDWMKEWTAKAAK